MTDFNPSEHNVDEVVAHLEQADTDEQVRVLEAEAADKDRATIRDWEPDKTPASTTEPDTASTTASTPASTTEPDTDADTEPDTDEYEFEQTEENAIYLLAAAAELGLSPSVITTNGGRLQAPAVVVQAAGDALDTDKD